MNSSNLVLEKEDYNGGPESLRFLTHETDSGWLNVDHWDVPSGGNDYLAYIKNDFVHVLKLGTLSTTASNSNASNSGNTTPEPTPDAGTFSGWAYFSSYPWVYNYDNKAWYYMQSTNEGLFAFNSNVSGNGWLKVGGEN